MAAPRRQPKTTEPNIVIPLAFSYNTRDIDGEANVFTDALDQRKINCIYEVVQNSMSGNATPYLAKRPGVDDLGSTYGVSSQVAYLVDVAAGATTLSNANHWVFSTNNNDVQVSDNSATTVIFTSANYIPVYVDKTILGGTDTCLLQTRNTSTNVQRVWYATAIGSWTEITDADFTTLSIKGKMEMMDGYAFAMTSNNRIYNSNLGSLSAWMATSFISKQITQDIPSGLAKYKKHILAFGQNTMEVFRNVGNATGSPLEAVPELSKNVGIIPVEGAGMRNYYTTHNDIMYFLGNNPKGLYAYNGNEVAKVSTNAMDKIISSMPVYNVSAVHFSGQAAIALTLTLPGTAAQKVLLYFPDWKDWFEWTTSTFQPVTSTRIGHTMLGSGSNGHKLYKISQDTENWQDASTNYTMSIQFKLPGGGNHIKRMSMCGVDVDTARSASSLNVSWSDDDYQTFSTARTIDLTSKTKMLMNCGSFRNRVMKLEHTGNSNPRFANFLARID